jgi:hypothetical protein
VPGPQDRPPALLPLADVPGHRRRTHRRLPHQRPVRAQCDDPEFGYRFLLDEPAKLANATGRLDQVRPVAVSRTRQLNTYRAGPAGDRHPVADETTRTTTIARIRDEFAQRRATKDAQ